MSTKQTFGVKMEHHHVYSMSKSSTTVASGGRCFNGHSAKSKQAVTIPARSRRSVRCFAKKATAKVAGADEGKPGWMVRRDARLEVELKGMNEQIDKMGFLDGLVLRMRRDSSNQSALEQKLQAAADDKFKGLRKWKFVFEDLRGWGIQSIPPEEALALLERGGALLLDVRELDKFQQGHAAGAMSAPLYTAGITGGDVWDKLRKVAFAAFAMKGTERNPDFLDQVKSAVGPVGGATKSSEKEGGRGGLFGMLKVKPLSREGKVLVMCQIGGSLETGEERIARGKAASVMGDYGNASRSLMAIHELYEAGYKNIVHVDGGFAQWKASKLPVTTN
eukprot:CAMPEP_0198208850 /NCGR_PEP_ID=MMETSP1445-20131203/12192_1 /TAXON_ID=36898 /ORGANISM="Pyramimonas sp., Strain CCMP2087" /LENGTH=333 /DNA_ID=CAMNT_0043882411 /DNA_START=65 /DNA_END=1066 /DNA_ORIENTATION=+